MTTDPLKAFWRQYRHRQSGKSGSGIAYAIYVTVLIAFIYGGPAFLRLVSALHDAEVVASIATPGVATGVSIALGLTLVGAFVVGTTRGPAVLKPFVAFALVTSDISRRRAFGRAMVNSAIVLTLVGAGVSALLLGPLAGTPAVDLRTMALGIVAAALFGLLTSVAWLAGQAARGAAVWAVPAALLVLIVTGFVLPGPEVLPWEWAAAAWPDGASAASALPVVLLLVAAVVLAAVTPLLLGSLSGPDLIDQARRWEGATVAATTGDLTTAMGGFRATPTVGRRWRVVRGGSFVFAALRADLLASLRMPLRAMISALTLASGGWVLVLASEAVGMLRPALAIVAALLVFAGLGPACDGLRHAVLAISAPRLFGVSDESLVLARAWAPLITGLVLAGGGAVAAALVGDGSPWLALVIVFVLVAVITIIRLDAAAKGTPPLWLTAPISTPMGDLSAIGTMLWQMDALIWSAITGAAVLSLWSGSTLGTTILGVIALIQFAQWKARLRHG